MINSETATSAIATNFWSAPRHRWDRVAEGISHLALHAAMLIPAWEMRDGEEQIKDGCNLFGLAQRAARLQEDFLELKRQVVLNTSTEIQQLEQSNKMQATELARERERRA